MSKLFTDETVVTLVSVGNNLMIGIARPVNVRLKAKIYGVTIIHLALSILMKHLVTGQRQKLLISRLLTGHHMVEWFP